jgi:hypothetical protein
VTVDHTAKTVEPDYTPHPNQGVNVPGTSWGSSVGISGGTSRGSFETVYRRAGQKAPEENKDKK